MYIELPHKSKHTKKDCLILKTMIIYGFYGAILET